MNQSQPEFERRHSAEDEVDLVELFLILWKRKWMIVIVTIVLTVSAVGVSLLLPKVYAVSAILEPGKGADGEVVESSQAIRENIIGGSFDREIAKKLNINLDKMPQFKVSVPKNTDLVKIIVESSEPSQSVEIMSSLLTRLTANIEEKLDIKKTLLVNELRSSQIDVDAYPEQITQVENLISVSKKKISELEAARKDNVTGTNEDAMAILLYLNEIQNQQVFLNSLYEKISELKALQKKAKLKVEELQIKQSSIRGTNISKHPSISEKPIKPKKTLIVVLAFVLGLMGGIMLAFMAEFMNKVRQQQLRVD